ncbi:uncharacterized protein N7482_003100 [Penicillium canariense]|uniref:Cyanovirin-N domain-containing protein n=1 Tax=Penicillium canariense TaxID=189055 RepID=A0A9W9IIA5_9EURO|nr:uncharacterized protein N7482_003100 [Penicillium canariense]KAJ5177223.1 hypothetical protein N7482_003100 [Penicillium canariense]
MSFHLSAVDIDLEDGHILKATLTMGDGEEVKSELDLNKYIGNNNGSFEWEGENFKDRAEDIEFSCEPRDDGEEIPVLRANLGNLDGEKVSADINLVERITNEDGHLKFVE